MKKRLLSALLLLAMLLAGCAGATENASTDGESSVLPEELPAWQDRVHRLNALYGDEITRLGKAPISLSKGCTVTASRKESGDLALLTNDVFYTSADKELVKFEGKDELSLTLDMGETKDNICDLGLSFLYAPNKKASVPKYVKYYVSDDGENYLLVGTAYRDAEVENEASNAVSLPLQSMISARYVKAVIEADAFLSENSYLDEFYVYSYGEALEETEEDWAYDPYYNNPPMPEVTEDLFWDKSDSDYTKKQNLVAGKSYRIKSTFRVDEQFQTDYYNSPITNKALTDGRTGGSSYSDGAYFHFTRFLGRTIIFDLEKVSGISSATVGFLPDSFPESCG